MSRQGSGLQDLVWWPRERNARGALVLYSSAAVKMTKQSENVSRCARAHGIVLYCTGTCILTSVLNPNFDFGRQALAELGLGAFDHNGGPHVHPRRKSKMQTASP